MWLILNNLKELFQAFEHKYPKIKVRRAPIEHSIFLLCTYCVCFYHQNAKLMVEAIGTWFPAGLENKVFSGKKRLKKLEKCMVFDSEKLEKLEMLLSLSLAWLLYPLETDALLHLTGHDFAITEFSQLSGSARVNFNASGIELTNFKWFMKKPRRKCWGIMNCFCHVIWHFSNQKNYQRNSSS